MENRKNNILETLANIARVVVTTVGGLAFLSMIMMLR
jgi:hypothetical protein